MDLGHVGFWWRTSFGGYGQSFKCRGLGRRKRQVWTSPFPSTVVLGVQWQERPDDRVLGRPSRSPRGTTRTRLRPEVRVVFPGSPSVHTGPTGTSQVGTTVSRTGPPGPGRDAGSRGRSGVVCTRPQSPFSCVSPLRVTHPSLLTPVTPSLRCRGPTSGSSTAPGPPCSVGAFRGLKRTLVVLSPSSPDP